MRGVQRVLQAHLSSRMRRSVGFQPALSTLGLRDLSSGSGEAQRRTGPHRSTRKVLLHSCCAPCSGAMVEAMVSAGHDVTIFFYNPNIHPRKEYEIRKQENKRFAATLGIPFVDLDDGVVGGIDVDEWYRRAKGMEFCPERGARCTMCFDMRLERTALYAHEHGFDSFTTTNATSRWKDEAQVNAAGIKAAAKYDGVEYWLSDWQGEDMTGRKYRVRRASTRRPPPSRHLPPSPTPPPRQVPHQRRAALLQAGVLWVLVLAARLQPLARQAGRAARRDRRRVVLLGPSGR